MGRRETICCFCKLHYVDLDCINNDITDPTSARSSPCQFLVHPVRFLLASKSDLLVPAASQNWECNLEISLNLLAKSPLLLFSFEAFRCYTCSMANFTYLILVWAVENTLGELIKHVLQRYTTLEGSQIQLSM